MRDYITIGLPIVLIIVALWFLFHQYRLIFQNWYKELTWKKIASYSFVVILKSIVMFFFIILIHNNFHDDHLLELVLFLLLFFVFAIVQSSYSFGGFLSRVKYIYLYARQFFSKRSENANNFKSRMDHTFELPYSNTIKVIILMLFLIVFIPNITVFVAANLLYVFFIAFLLLLSMMLNNIIYTGLIALIVFQYDPVSIDFENANYVMMTLTFLIILSGFVIETRMDNRMFFIKTVMSVKSFKFHLGYEKLYTSNSLVIYQNLVNHYYYFNYRITGLVIVYDSLIDLRISPFITRKMVQKGTQYLKETNEL